MKTLAALLMAVSITAHAQGDAQKVCAVLADVGKSAAYANASGVTEFQSLEAWQYSSADGAKGTASDAVFQMGIIEIRAVYRNNDTDQGTGYWTAYNACMASLK